MINMKQLKDGAVTIGDIERRLNQTCIGEFIIAE